MFSIKFPSYSLMLSFLDCVYKIISLALGLSWTPLVCDHQTPCRSSQPPRSACGATAPFGSSLNCLSPLAYLRPPGSAGCRQMCTPLQGIFQLESPLCNCFHFLYPDNLLILCIGGTCISGGCRFIVCFFPICTIYATRSPSSTTVRWR